MQDIQNVSTRYRRNELVNRVTKELHEDWIIRPKLTQQPKHEFFSHYITSANGASYSKWYKQKEKHVVISFMFFKLWNINECSQSYLFQNPLINFRWRFILYSSFLPFKATNYNEQEKLLEMRWYHSSQFNMLLVAALYMCVYKKWLNILSYLYDWKGPWLLCKIYQLSHPSL